MQSRGILPRRKESLPAQNKESGGAEFCKSSNLEKILPKIELTSCDGSNPRVWIRIRKCQVF